MTKTNKCNKVILVYSSKDPEILFVENAVQNHQLLKSHRS